MELMQCHAQWASRPADERFVSLTDMLVKQRAVRENSRTAVVSTRALTFQPSKADGMKGLEVYGPNGHGYNATHWAFGQLASLAKAPAGYLRTLPAPLAADNLNYGMRFGRDVEETGVLLTKMDGANILRAANGPNFGRVWNADITRMLIDRFGNGLDGHWRVPGEFGKRVSVTKENTTLYSSDRDMFVFLCDEDRRIDVADRRNGQPGSMARGVFVWNSEEGGMTLGAAFFLFDYVCCNRIVWGAQQFKQIKLRHTSGAPDRWAEEIQPAIQDYAEASAKPIVALIAQAKARKIDEDLADFLNKRFTKSVTTGAMAAHIEEEGRPIETLWDAVTGVTAYAKALPHQDARIDIERKAGELLELAA